MSLYVIPLARSAQGNRKAQSYKEHVDGMVKKALKKVEAFKPYISEERFKRYIRVISSAAFYHDLGKLNEKNQEVLHGDKKEKRLPVEHRDAGVKFLLGNECERIEATLVFAHHRPGLPDLSRQKVSSTPFRFLEAMSDSELNLQKYLKLHEQETERFSLEEVEKTGKSSAMEYRMLLSCLVDADYSDASGEQQKYVPAICWEERQLQLDKYIDNLQKENGNGERNRLRNLLYHSCKNAETDSIIEYCDGPVGTGKTTAVMAHMLRVAQKYKLRHIFVVLPYTNLISQTVKVLRDAVVLEGEVKEKIVAEHHHQADFEDPEYRHLASLWTAPIIVTTAVQFFETLSGNLPAKLRKLNQLPGSGIILDEYHTMLPIRLMLPAWKWLTELGTEWGCRICMSSATAIKFWEHPSFHKLSMQQVKPLVNEKVSLQLKKFERSRINLNVREGSYPHFNGMKELKRYIENFPGPNIIVFNTIQNAACFANYLNVNGCDVLHLSSALTPEDKESTIDEVNRRLDQRNNYPENWILVATSCAECGMDFSFRNGFCELRSYQSFIQLGGRVSRKNEYQGSMLNVFTITENKFSRNPEFDISQGIFVKMISEKTLQPLSDSQIVTKAFYEECKKCTLLSDDICKKDKGREFETVAERFHVIEEAKISVKEGYSASRETITVVANQMLAQKIRSEEKISENEFQRGSVNLRYNVWKRLKLTENELPILAESQYDSFLGYMKSLV